MCAHVPSFHKLTSLLVGCYFVAGMDAGGSPKSGGTATFDLGISQPEPVPAVNTSNVSSPVRSEEPVLPTRQVVLA